jgi:hypothetical protein
MTVQVADAHAHIQRLVSVVKMAIVLEECIPNSSVLFVRFYRQEDSMQKDIHKEMVHIYGGKYLSCKAVHSWV